MLLLLLLLLLDGETGSGRMKCDFESMFGRVGDEDGREGLGEGGKWCWLVNACKGARWQEERVVVGDERMWAFETGEPIMELLPGLLELTRL